MTDWPQPSRAWLLDEAKRLITRDRNNQYGPPSQDFERWAGAAAAMGYQGPEGRPIRPYDLAILMSLLKISRLMWTPEKADSWIDLAGYAGCGYEVATTVVEVSTDGSSEESGASGQG